MKKYRKWLVWSRRLLLLLAGLVAGLVLFVAGVLLFMGDEQYRRVLIWSADHFLDSDLVIDGPFSLRYAEGLKLAVGAMRLQARDGGYVMHSGTFNAQFGLPSLLSGVLLVDDLAISDFYLRVNETAAGSEHDHGNLDLPTVLIARADVNDLVIEYQETEPEMLHRVALDRLTIDDVNNSGQLTVGAAGTFENHPFKIDGVIPPLKQVLDMTRQKPVKLTIESETVKVDISGTIMDPLTGTGMDLAVHSSLAGVQELAEIFDDGVPPLGDLEFSARMRGDYQVPELDEIVLHLKREGDVDFTISGTIPDALTGEGMRLQINGSSGDPQVLSYLLFKRENRLGSLRVKGLVRKQQKAYYIDDLDTEAVTREGLKLSVAGSGRLFGGEHVIGRQDAAFSAKITAPRIAALNQFGIEGLPELGPLSGTARLAISTTAIGLYGADIRAGAQRTGVARLKGDIGHVPLKQGTAIAGLAMQVEVRAASLAGLGRKLGVDWPELGATSLTGDLGIQGDRIILDKLRLAIGNPQQPVIKATGKAWRQLQKGSSIDIDFDMATADLVAAFSEKVPGYLGRLRGSTNISDIDGSWGLERVDLASYQTRLFSLTLNGSYDDLEKHDQIDLKTDVGIDDPAAFGNALGWTLAGIKGPYRTKGWVTGSKDKIRYQGSASLGQSTSKTDISANIGGKKPSFSGKMKIPVLHLADLGLDVAAIPDVGGGAGAESNDQPIFSRQRLDVGFLDKFNLDFAFLIDRIESKEFTIASVNARARLNDGRLSIDPLKLVFEGGDSVASFSVANGNPPEYGLKIIADDVLLGPLLSQVQDNVPINGYSNIDIDLTASGRSPHEIAAGLNGTVDLGLENVRIPKLYIEMLSVDVFGWALSRTFSKERYADINCVVVGFDVNEGHMNSKVIVADGPRLSLSGRIDLDLGAETMDIVIIPKQKKRIFSSISPVKLQGPWRDPKVTAIPAKAAIKEVGGLALLPTVAIPVMLIDKLWSLVDDGDTKGTGCSNIKTIGEAVPKKAPQRNGKD
jgi:hypothetical protein